MSTTYAFTINGTDHRGLVSKYGYETTQVPVEGNRVTTLNGVDHVSVVRYRSVLTVTINPTTPAQFQALCASIRASNPVEVTFHNLQTGQDQASRMTVSGLQNAITAINANRTILNGVKLTFTEL